MKKQGHVVSHMPLFASQILSVYFRSVKTGLWMELLICILPQLRVILI